MQSLTDLAGQRKIRQRLNAAAPELLSALEDSADAIDAVCVKIDGAAKDALGEINRRNRATIAKARGVEL